MIDRVSVSECVLCGSCANSCPVDAISYKTEYLDFLYPQIDPRRCIGCNNCEQACPVLRKTVEKGEDCPAAYIAKNRNMEIRKKSTSGGVFFEAAKSVLEKGGFVCGAVFDDEFHVRHICSDRMEDVYRMMGSKYAQSDMGRCMQQARKQLDAGKSVLFTGCPCQAAGFRAFLGRPYEKLILMELVCHGIPSDAMLQSYISLQEKRYRSTIRSIDFRNKKTGWHNSSVLFSFENGKCFSEYMTVDPYMQGYFRGITLKESCFICRFREFTSGCDLTIGDFWGAEVELPDMDDNTGLSAVIINSAKGQFFFDSLRMETVQIDLEKVIRHNQYIIDSPEKNGNREAFYHYAQTHGYPAAIRALLKESVMAKAKRKIRYGLRCLYYRLTGRAKPIY